MKVKTSELIGPALRWAVAEAEWKGGVSVGCLIGQQIYCYDDGEKVLYEPDTNWSQGGPIIEREIGSLWKWNNLDHQCDPPVWYAVVYKKKADHIPLAAEGPTPLIAAMRTYVASKLGDEVDVPEELCG